MTALYEQKSQKSESCPDESGQRRTGDDTVIAPQLPEESLLDTTLRENVSSIDWEGGDAPFSARLEGQRLAGRQRSGRSHLIWQILLLFTWLNMVNILLSREGVEAAASSMIDMSSNRFKAFVATPYTKPASGYSGTGDTFNTLIGISSKTTLGSAQIQDCTRSITSIGSWFFDITSYPYIYKSNTDMDECFGGRNSVNKQFEAIVMQLNTVVNNAKTLIITHYFTQAQVFLVDIQDSNSAIGDNGWFQDIGGIGTSSSSDNSRIGIFALDQIDSATADGMNVQTLRIVSGIPASESLASSNYDKFRTQMTKMWFFEKSHITSAISSYTYDGWESLDGGDTDQWYIQSDFGKLLDGKKIVERDVEHFTYDTSRRSYYSSHTCFAANVGGNVYGESTISGTEVAIATLHITNDVDVTDILGNFYYSDAAQNTEGTSSAWSNKNVRVYLFPKGDPLASLSGTQLRAILAENSKDRIQQLLDSANIKAALNTNGVTLSTSKNGMPIACTNSICDSPGPGSIVFEFENGLFNSCGFQLIGTDYGVPPITCPTDVASECPTFDTDILSWNPAINNFAAYYLSKNQASITSSNKFAVATTTGLTEACGSEADCTAYIDYKVHCADSQGDAKTSSYLIAEQSTNMLGQVQLQIKADTSAEVFYAEEWSCQVIGKLGGNEAKSQNFTITIDASDTCDTADSIAPADYVDVAQFSDPILVDSSTWAESEIGFTEFGNSICPTYCFGGQSCTAATLYTVNCKHEDENGDEVAWYDVSSVTGNGHWISAKVDDSTNEDGKKAVFIKGTNAHCIDKIFTCRLKGIQEDSTGSESAYTKEFTFTFSPCGVPGYCVNVTHSDINYPSSTAEKTASTFFVDVSATNTSSAFPEFQDSLTSTCSYAADCHLKLSYEVYWYDCSTCDDPDTCDDAGCDAFAAQTNPVTTSRDTDTETFTFTNDENSAIGAKHFMAKIVAQSSSKTDGDNVVESLPFRYYHDGYPVCNTAQLIDVTEGNKPDYSSDLVWDSAETSTTSFTEFSNTICPKYCYKPERQCSSPTYSVLCREPPTVTPGDPASVAITTTDVVAVTDTNTYNTEITSSSSNVFFREFNCLVEGSLNGYTKQTEEFTIKWDYCNTEGVCPKVTHLAPDSADIPRGIVSTQTDADDTLGMIIDLGGPTNTSVSFPAFKDNITADCGVSGDCHAQLVYSLQYIDCTSCTSSCDNYASCTIQDMNPSSLIVEKVDPADDTLLQIRSLTAQNTIKKQFRMRIRAKSSVITNAPYVYSDWFKVFLNNTPKCNLANLLDSGENKPVFDTNIPIGADGLTSASFTEFENDICPDYCYWEGESCGEITYEVLCINYSTGQTVYVDPVANYDFTSVEIAAVASSDPQEYTVKIVGERLSLLGQEFRCKIKGTLDASSDTALSNYFEVRFSACADVDASCPTINYWEASIYDANPSFVPPEDVEFAVFQSPTQIEFNYNSWKYFLHQECGSEVCGTRVFTWEMLDGSDIPLTNSQVKVSPATQRLTLNTDDLNHIGEYELRLKGYVNSVDDGKAFTWEETVYFSTIKVTVTDPCLNIVDQEFKYDGVEMEDKQINLDTGEAQEWIMDSWDNSINIFNYPKVHPSTPSPLCGFPQNYKIMACQLDGTPLNDVQGLDFEYELDTITGNVKLLISSQEMAFNDTEIDVCIVAFNTSETGEVYGHASSDTFRLNFWAEPIKDIVPPEVTASPESLSIDNQAPAEEKIVIVTVTQTDLPLDTITVNLGTAKTFASYSIAGNAVEKVITIKINVDATTPLGANTINIRVLDTEGNQATQLVDIEVTGIAPPTDSGSGSDTGGDSGSEESQDGQDTKTGGSSAAGDGGFDFTANFIFKGGKKGTAFEEEEEFILEAKIESISSTGLMEITWNDFVITTEVEKLKAEDYMIFLKQFSEEKDQSAEFTFVPTKFTPTGLFTQLNFLAPFQISAGAKFDEVHVYMRRDILMVQDIWGLHENFDYDDEEEKIDETTQDGSSSETTSSRRMLKKQRLSDPKYYSEDLFEYPELEEQAPNEITFDEQNKQQRSIRTQKQRDLQFIFYDDEETYVKLIGQIPPQVELGAAIAVAAQAESAGDLLATLFWLPFVVQIVMSSAMAHVWNILNTIQVVNTFPLFALSVPENVKSVLISFNRIANLKIVPKEDVYAFFDKFLNPEEQNKIDGNESQKIEETNQKAETEQPEGEETGLSKNQQNLKDFGMGNSKVLVGAMQLLVGVAALGATLFIIFFCKEYICYNAPPWFKNVFVTIDQKIRYNAVLRAMIESYYGICMSSMLTIRDKWSWETTESMINSLFTLAFLPYLIGFPIFIITFLDRNRFALSNKDFQKRYNSLYLNVDYFKRKGLAFTAVLLIRKFVLVFDTIFFGFSPIAQVATALYASNLLAQFLLRTKPMVDGVNNFIQLFNEICILFWTIQLMNFSDYVPYPETRFELGWYFLYQIYFNVSVNAFLIVFLVIKQVYTNLKRRKLLNQIKERHRQIKAQNEHIYRLGKHKGIEYVKKRFRTVKNSNDSIDDSDNNQEINIDQIGKKPAFTPERERTFLQKRKDAKENFLARMAKWREEDLLKKMKKQGRDPSEMTYEERKSLEAKLMPIPTEVQAWEHELWDDVVQDASGNILKKKQKTANGLDIINEEEDQWEVVSSDSVIQRRKLQEATDWPLSARLYEEKKKMAEKNKNRVNDKARLVNPDEADKVSNQWSWDNEKESDISNWLGMPKEEFKKSNSFGSSFIMSDRQPANYLPSKPDDNIFTISETLPKIPMKATMRNSLRGNDVWDDNPSFSEASLSSDRLQRNRDKIVEEEEDDSSNDNYRMPILQDNHHDNNDISSSSHEAQTKPGQEQLSKLDISQIEDDFSLDQDDNNLAKSQTKHKGQLKFF